MKRILLAICSVLAFSPLVQLRARATDLIPQKQLETFKSLERVDRRISINPTLVTEGIKSGLVIAYGHVIRPPYNIDYQGDRLFVNDVQVRPSLIKVREREKRRAKRSKNINRGEVVKLLTEEVQILYSGAADKDRVRMEILSHVKKHPAVDDAQWDGADSLSLRLRGDSQNSFGYMIVVGHGAEIALSSSTPMDMKKQFLNDITLNLSSGRSAFFASGGEIYWGPDPRQQVNQIMLDVTLTKEERIRRLLLVFSGSNFPALDVLANYEANEWRTPFR